MAEDPVSQGLALDDPLSSEAPADPAECDDALARACEQLIGYTFNDTSLLARAVTHASSANTRLDSNERLEFLGDAILGFVVCDLVYERYPDLLEGEMTKIKSAVVSRRTCARIARAEGLEALLRTGKGMAAGGELPSSLAAAVMESLIAAVYLDGGMGPTRAMIERWVLPRIERSAASGHQENFKSVLQQHAQQELDETPCYVVLDEQGPDHAKCFEVRVELGARRFESCWGASKKQAEQMAAKSALAELGLLDE